MGSKIPLDSPQGGSHCPWENTQVALDYANRIANREKDTFGSPVTGHAATFLSVQRKDFKFCFACVGCGAVAFEVFGFAESGNGDVAGSGCACCLSARGGSCDDPRFDFGLMQMTSIGSASTT